ncbi:mitochondrial nuclease [Morchella snyderi]|nr:mitochondrial nuclease [Morchella snyderi]
MSKITLGIIAAASAATGAAATAFYLAGTKPKPTSTAVPAGVASKLPVRRKPEEGGPSLVDPSGLFQYGFPGPVADIATRKLYVSSYDRRTRNPHWVAEHITPESLATRDGDRGNSKFLEDEAIPSKFRALLKDYYRSGYDRGHQAPAADAKFSQTAMDETFYLTNMCPQVGQGFNRDYWAHLEDFCRRLTTRYPSVRIVTGPLYLPRQHADGKWRVSYEVVGDPPNVAVPTHFYKLVVAEDGKAGGAVAVAAFVLPNAPIGNGVSLAEFEVPVEVVERASGLTFLDRLEEGRRRQLCKEIECSLVVREFDNASKGERRPRK